MHFVENLGELWGTRVYDLRFDLLLHRLTLFIKDEEVNKLTFYELTFFDVKECIYKNLLSYYGCYTELTTIEINKKDSEFYIEIELGTDDCTMVVKCLNYKLVIVAEEEAITSKT